MPDKGEEDFHVPTDAEVAKYYVKGRGTEYAETEVLRWLVNERKRVGSFATKKTVNMVVGLLKANLSECTCTDFECADCAHDLWYTDAIELIEKEFGTKINPVNRLRDSL